MINLTFAMIDINFLGESLIHTKHSVHEGSDENADDDIIMSPSERQKITRLIGIPVQAGVFEDCTSEFRDQNQVDLEVRAKVSEAKM